MRKNYLWYQFFRYGIVRPALQLFYSDITVSGREHIPQGKPVIFVVNHQNSFIDALHLVTNTKLFIHFLTRADPFENPILGPFFRSLNMLPVYRVRDGFSAIKRNKQTFEECYSRLKDNDGVLVFAEANHDLKRRIRPLSKGFTRIAFGAAERFNWELDLQVMPVGMNYGDHQKSQTPVHIEFGNCIPLSEFHQQYVEDEREAALELKKATAEELKKVTMHVSNLNHYPLYHLLLDELEDDRESLIRPEIVNRRVSLIKEQYNKELLGEAKQVLEKAESKNLNIRDFISSRSFGLKDLLLSPFYLFSGINNILPYQVVRWVINDYIEDHVFDASAKFIIGLVLLPMFYLLVSVVLGFLGVSFPIILGYFGVSILTAPLFVRARDLLSSNSGQKLRDENPGLHEEIKAEVERFMKLRQEILED